MTTDYQKGHRNRLRDRFFSDTGKSMPDYELLELVLTTAIPQKDVKDLAKDLLKTFGSFANIISASKEDLTSVKGIGDVVAAALMVIKVAADRCSWQSLCSDDGTVLSNWDGLIDYCRSSMCYQNVEEFRIIFLDSKGKIITQETHQKGTIDGVAVYVREVVNSVLKNAAKSVILVHNHPSGVVTPSQMDIDITKKIVEALQNIEVIVWDHLIVSKSNVYSFKSYGLLPLIGK